MVLDTGHWYSTNSPDSEATIEEIMRTLVDVKSVLYFAIFDDNFVSKFIEFWSRRRHMEIMGGLEYYYYYPLK